MPDTITTTVTIAGRAFRVGATYAAKNPKSLYQARVFLGRCQRGWKGWVDYHWPWSPADYRHPITMGSWAKWAGEEVEPHV